MSSKDQNKTTNSLSSLRMRPNTTHYDENLIKPNEILSNFKSKYSKFNTSSDFIKTTLSIFPNSPQLINQLKLPVGINISPLSSFIDETSIPLCDYGKSYDIPACKNKNCKAYLNPFVKFIHGSDQWICNFCNNINKTLDYYYCAVDQDGVRLDQNTKSELNFGTYDFVSYKESWSKDRPPVTNSFYFLIDISQNSIKSGFAQCVLETIKDIINNNNFYNYENFETKICLLTYDKEIHFYPINIKNDNEQNITMLSINEKENELFVPTNRDYLLVDLKKYKNKFLQIIENIQNRILSYNNNIKEADRFFDVIKICNLINNKHAGKILIFSGSNISKLKLMNGENSQNLDNNKYSVTDEGKIGKLGISISINGLSTNIFECCDTDTNLKTLNQLITNSNGNLFFYRKFNPDLHYKNIYNQISKILMNQNIYEGGLKILFSHNFFIKEYLTPVLLYNREIIYYPNLDSDQNYSLLLGIKDEGNETETKINEDYFFLQASLIYNRGDGKKRMRVYNLCLPFSSRPKDIYDSINPEVLTNFMSQYLIMNIYRNKKLPETVDDLEKKYFQINDIFFNNSNDFKKELSEEMKLFSLYFLSLMKNCLFNKNERGYNNDNDLSNFYRTKIQKMKYEEIICFIYPRIYVLDNVLELQTGEFPLIINDNRESMDSQGSIFLIDNGFNLILYIKNNVDKNIIFNLFGVNTLNEVNTDILNESSLFDYDENKNEYKEKIIEIIDNIRGGKSLFQNLNIICQNINDKNGTIINEILVEDNNNKGYPYNYEQFYNKIVFGSKIK